MHTFCSWGLNILICSKCLWIVIALQYQLLRSRLDLDPCSTNKINAHTVLRFLQSKHHNLYYFLHLHKHPSLLIQKVSPRGSNPQNQPCSENILNF